MFFDYANCIPQFHTHHFSLNFHQGAFVVSHLRISNHQIQLQIHSYGSLLSTLCDIYVAPVISIFEFFVLRSPFSVSPPPIVFVFAFAYPASCSEPSITSLSLGRRSFMMTRFLLFRLFAPASCSEPSITSLSTIASICRLQLPPGGLCGEPPSNTKSRAFNFQLPPGAPCVEPPSNTKSCAFAWL